MHCHSTSNFAAGFLLSIEMAVFVDGNGKNGCAVHKKGGFRGRGPGYLLYLHDLGVILSVSEGS